MLMLSLDVNFGFYPKYCTIQTFVYVFDVIFNFFRAIGIEIQIKIGNNN